MANLNGAAEVAKTPTTEQNAGTEADPAEEQDVNGQQPDSMFNCCLKNNHGETNGS